MNKADYGKYCIFKGVPSNCLKKDCIVFIPHEWDIRQGNADTFKTW